MTLFAAIAAGCTSIAVFLFLFELAEKVMQVKRRLAIRNPLDRTETCSRARTEISAAPRCTNER